MAEYIQYDVIQIQPYYTISRNSLLIQLKSNYKNRNKPSSLEIFVNLWVERDGPGDKIDPADGQADVIHLVRVDDRHSNVRLLITVLY